MALGEGFNWNFLRSANQKDMGSSLTLDQNFLRYSGYVRLFCEKSAILSSPTAIPALTLPSSNLVLIESDRETENTILL